MARLDRAAQFSPFAALTGYDAAIEETSRITEARIELVEDEKALLNDELIKAVEANATVRITYFLQDDKKSGGAYVCAEGRVKKFDTLYGVISLSCGVNVPTDDIVGVDIL
jgi:hypothetical protein